MPLLFWASNLKFINRCRKWVEHIHFLSHIINRPILNASLNNDKRKLAMYFGIRVKDIKVELITVIDELGDIKRTEELEEMSDHFEFFPWILKQFFSISFSLTLSVSRACTPTSERLNKFCFVTRLYFVAEVPADCDMECGYFGVFFSFHS